MKTGFSKVFGCTLLGLSLSFSGTASADTPATNTVLTSRAAVTQPRTADPTRRVETPDFVAILQTLEQLESSLPTKSDLITRLRGQLYRYERQSQREKFDLVGELRKARQTTTSRLPGSSTRKPGDWQREPEPGNNLYTPCVGLTNEALKEKLQSITEYQVGLDYREARRQMFTRLDNVGGSVECVYTGRKGRYSALPNDRDMNCEHTWPQSHGAVGIAKSDLHHLFPTDSEANSKRGSLPFGPVNSAEWAEGGSKCDGDVFEVRPEQRGNTARAKFYFAVRYGKRIESEEEATLREWHKQDPVDDFERRRNDLIENLQHNRNPFVDHPEFVDQISDF
ncbi:MAG TPA: endonuclease [Candidatus Ozemobacteraceae bacterium]|nr:endonuclease [Candidatus Ozemobacteraceae bacterium]